MEQQQTLEFNLHQILVLIKSLNVDLIRKFIFREDSQHFFGFKTYLETFDRGDIGRFTKYLNYSSKHKQKYLGHQLTLKDFKQRELFNKLPFIMSPNQSINYIKKLFNVFPDSSHKVIVTLPASPYYNALLQTNLNSRYKSLQKYLEDLPKINIHYWDLINYPIKLESYSNSDHIFYQGREEYTEALFSQIKQLSFLPRTLLVKIKIILILI